MCAVDTLATLLVEEIGAKFARHGDSCANAGAGCRVCRFRFVPGNKSGDVRGRANMLDMSRSAAEHCLLRDRLFHAKEAVGDPTHEAATAPCGHRTRRSSMTARHRQSRYEGGGHSVMPSTQEAVSAPCTTPAATHDAQLLVDDKQVKLAPQLAAPLRWACSCASRRRLAVARGGKVRGDAAARLV